MIVESVVILISLVNPAFSALSTLDPSNGIDANCKTDFVNQTSGAFQSPGFDFHLYPANIKCGWAIEYGIMSDFMLTIHNFELETALRCAEADYMKFYKYEQGSGWSTVGLQSGYCGAMESFTFTTSAKKLYIKFRSNHHRQRNGFNISFVVKPQLAPKINYLGVANEMTNQLQVLQLEQNDVINLQCHSNGTRPAPIFKWNKMNNGLREAIRPEIVASETNGGIMLVNLTIADSGFYQCSASNIYGADAKSIQIVVTKRCPCPRTIKVAWLDSPPYTNYMNGRIRLPGIFDTILTNMVAKVCGSCAKIVLSDNHKKTDLKSLDDNILDEDSTADIYFPLQSGVADNRYRLKYYFLPVMSSPGMAHIVKRENPDNAELLWNTIKHGWPICVMTIVLSILAGIIIWSLDTYWNEDQFPRAFSSGIVEGFWWAIISMTTVGYGDIAPVSVPARLFAIAWILTGLVIVAIFTSVLSATLTVTVLSSEVKLYGAKTGALKSSVEYRQGVMKRANMSKFNSIEDMRFALDKNIINGVLMDSYVAGYYSSAFQKYKLNRVFKTRKAYGFVLGRRLSSKFYYQKFQNYYESNKEDILGIVVNSTITLKKKLKTDAISSADELISDDNRFFKWSIQISAIIFGVLVVGGLLFEYCYLRPRHRMIVSAKKTDLFQSKAVKEMVFRTDLLKITLSREVKRLKTRWTFKMAILQKRHQIEVKKFKKKMKNRGTPLEDQMEHGRSGSVSTSHGSSASQSSQL